MRFYDESRDQQPVELDNSIVALGLIYVAAMVAGLAILAGAW